MTRDYKRPRKGTARSGGSLMAGILIGLLLGLIIALSVAWYINKMPSPFVSRNAPSTTPATPLGTVETPPAVPAAGTVAGNTDNGNSGNANGKSRFDFYQILSGNQETTPPPPPTQQQQQSTQQPAQQPQSAQRHPVQQQPVQPVQRQPVQTVAQTPPAHSGHGQFYLQAGAFRGGPEADNLKARLALLGIEADVQTATVPDQGVMHRVRIGPYSSADDANHARAQLSQNGIPTTVVKVAQ
ncbi:MAG TPA: SPOR domain-containing protein [Burkholderiales bacterium]|nr:SPOR domain-containing protein [Burkholderiales bacterium]